MTNPFWDAADPDALPPRDFMRGTFALGGRRFVAYGVGADGRSPSGELFLWLGSMRRPVASITSLDDATTLMDLLTRILHGDGVVRTVSTAEVRVHDAGPAARSEWREHFGMGSQALRIDVDPASDESTISVAGLAERRLAACRGVDDGRELVELISAHRRARVPDPHEFLLRDGAGGVTRYGIAFDPDGNLDGPATLWRGEPEQTIAEIPDGSAAVHLGRALGDLLEGGVVRSEVHPRAAGDGPEAQWQPLGAWSRISDEGRTRLELHVDPTGESLVMLPSSGGRMLLAARFADTADAEAFASALASHLRAIAADEGADDPAGIEVLTRLGQARLGARTDGGADAGAIALLRADRDGVVGLGRFTGADELARLRAALAALDGSWTSVERSGRMNAGFLGPGEWVHAEWRLPSRRDPAQALVLSIVQRGPDRELALTCSGNGAHAVPWTIAKLHSLLAAAELARLLDARFEVGTPPLG
ncbi:hypothetical protein USB125703_01371 [Pseudoclavibacter triregionum]|nr:hypothetical protein USB125703_01371 [Pseudoclavibacter triregionum]